MVPASRLRLCVSSPSTHTGHRRPIFLSEQIYLRKQITSRHAHQQRAHLMSHSLSATTEESGLRLAKASCSAKNLVTCSVAGLAQRSEFCGIQAGGRVKKACGAPS